MIGADRSLRGNSSAINERISICPPKGFRRRYRMVEVISGHRR